MKISISKVSTEPRWFPYQGARLKIRPILLSKTNTVLTPEGNIMLPGEELCSRFKEALMAWETVTDDDGKELPCTDEVKQIVFDHQMGGIPNFVLGKAFGDAAIKEEEEKNSSSGRAGSSKKTK